MSTLDEIAAAEDQLAEARARLEAFGTESRTWQTQRQTLTPADLLRGDGVTGAVTDLGEGYFREVEARRADVERAAARLVAVKRAFLAGI
jgi:hypothetical protein